MERIAAQANCTLHEVRTDSLYNTYDIWQLHAGQTPTTCLLIQRYVPVWAVTQTVPISLLSDDAGVVDIVLDGEPGFEALGWQRMSSTLASRPLDGSALALLSDQERQEIGYWKAENIGQALFNDWD